MKIRISTSQLIGLFLAFGFIAANAQTLVLSEPFDPAKGDLEGAAVKSWDTGTYARAPKWRVTQGSAMFSDGRVTTAEPGGATFNLATPNRAEGILCLKAEVGLGRQGTDFIGLGFLSSPDAVFWNQPLVATLAPDGKVRLYREGTEEVFWTSRVIPGFDRENIYPFEMRYDRSGGSVDILIDNEKLNDEPIDLAPFANDDEIGSVSIRIHANKDQDVSGIATVDNFRFTVKPDFKSGGKNR
jgi:hypothetical protein